VSEPGSLEQRVCSLEHSQADANQLSLSALDRLVNVRFEHFKDLMASVAESTVRKELAQIAGRHSSPRARNSDSACSSALLAALSVKCSPAPAK